MARNYNSLKEFLESRYPELRGKVVGAHHPPPWHAAMMQQLAGVVQWGGIGLMFFGGSMFKIIAVPEPSWYRTFTENKMNAMIAMFFMNSICNSMVATGAFEVTVDGQLIFSKLQSGRMPSAGDIIGGMESIGMKLLERGDDQSF
jgi:selT/selW/selH-like putative selenoprotein